MSFKSKNLAFEASEPAFLRRLRGEARGNIDDPDRHTKPTVLSKAPKRLENDEDDAPTYVVEGSNDTMSKEEYEKLVNGKSEDADPSPKATVDDSAQISKPAQKVAEVGVVSKKRKATRVGDDEEDEEVVKKSTDKRSKSAGKKSKSKAKNVKLSFANEDENT